jgi:hypothetical protein
VRGLRPPDEPDVGHTAGEGDEALEDVVPHDLRILDAAYRYLDDEQQRLDDFPV